MSELEAGNVDKILQKDLENIMAKAESGKPLTARERTLIEQVGKAPDDSEEQGALLLGEPAPAFDLFAGETRYPLRKSKNNYRFQAVVYQELYSANERTIQRWIKTGREVEEKPPLDEPPALRRWWIKYKKNAVPAGIVAAVKKCPWGSDAPAESVALELPAQSSAPENFKTDDSDALERLRKNEAVAGKNMEEAYVSKDDVEIEQATKNFERAAKLRAQFEPRYIERLREQKQLFTLSDLVECAQELHAPIIERVRALKAVFFDGVHEKFTPEAEAYWQEQVEKTLITSLHNHFIELPSRAE